MGVVLAKKHDIRFQISEGTFQRIKQQAEFYDETVTAFSRRSVIDRVFALEVQQANKVLSSLAPLLKHIQETVGFEKIADDLDGAGAVKVSPALLKMMEAFSEDSEEAKEG